MSTMIPWKLIARNVTRSAASLVLPHTSFDTATIGMRVPSRTNSAFVIAMHPVLRSHHLAYSTESTSSKATLEQSLEPEESQPPPPSSTKPQGEESSKTQPIKMKNDKQQDNILTRQEASNNPQEKIQSDKLYKAIELEVLSYEPAVLDSYQWFVITAATHLGITVGKCWSPLKSDKHRFPLLKSAFVHKKHQVHYEIRTYHRFLTFHKLTGSTADTFLEYIERNIPEGVGMKVTRVEVQPLPEYLQKH